jgi:nucleolar protein 53
VQKPSAVLLPHPGQSYNPTFEDHQALLAQEHAKALKEEQDAEKARQVKEAWLAGEEDNPDAYATGYAAEVGEGDDEEENIEGDDEFVKKVKKQKRKTDKEKKRRAANKALEAHTRAQTRLAKSQRQALSELSRVVSSVDSSSSISLSQLHKRKTMLANKLAMTGLTDLRSGPAKVPKAKQALLLSEELPESLRQLKTDGNLWGDWLDSSRRRGKVQTERKPYGRMTKKKGRGLKSIEKVAWRKFEA